MFCSDATCRGGTVLIGEGSEVEISLSLLLTCAAI